MLVFQEQEGHKGFIFENLILLETHYLPSLEYFVLLKKSKETVIHTRENYQKQTYRNRCYVLGANKVQLLTVPVNNGNKKVVVKDVTIDYSQKWYMEHIRTFKSAYGKAPYFEYYIDFFIEILSRKEKYLCDLNWQMLTLCLKLVNFDTRISDLAQGQLNLSELDDRYYGQLSRKTSFLDRNIYKESSYQQVFGNNFVPNLSIIDLLFCEGPNSGTIINQSTYSVN